MEPKTVQIEKQEFLSNLQILKDEYVPNHQGTISNHLIDYNKITVNDDAIVVERGSRFNRWLKGLRTIHLNLQEGAKGQTIIASDIDADTFLLLQLIPALLVFMPTSIFVIGQGRMESMIVLFLTTVAIGVAIWWSYRSNERNLDRHIERLIDEVTLFSKVD